MNSYKNVFKFSPVPQLIVSNRNYIIDANKKFLQVFHGELNEFKEQHLDSIFEDPNASTQLFTDAFSHKKKWAIKTRHSKIRNMYIHPTLLEDVNLLTFFDSNVYSFQEPSININELKKYLISSNTHA